MRNSLWLAVLAACGGADSAPRHPMSVEAHVTEAQAHERAAAEHDRAASAEERAGHTDPYCGDRAIASQPAVSIAPVGVVTPCWTSHHAERDAHLRRAAALRHDARRHRTIAADLLAAERVACAKIPPAERDHSPSWHADDVIRVEPVRDGGPVIGARLVFREVEGLTADWLRDAYACQQAIAAVEGYPPAFNSYCPAVLEDVVIDVVRDADGLAVTMRSARTEIAAEVFTRATALILPR